MQYNGKYRCFNADQIKTYPVAGRTNKVKLSDLIDVTQITESAYTSTEDESIKALAQTIVNVRKSNKPVIFFTGAHLVKNGLGPIVVDLIRRKVLTLVATNGAGTIHDFELALFGETSEYVPNALPEGQFGMATELGFINAVLAEGNQRQFGYGESLGCMIHDNKFRQSVEKRLGRSEPIRFQHPEVSIIAAAYENNIPLTVHVGIGTDVIDQHPNFDGSDKGGCSGRDFLIYTNEVTQLANGGVALNIASAVTGPEVLLKAVSMAGNIGKAPFGIITADFDLKPYHHEAMKDEGSCYYYFRHHKSVVTRIPEAFNGKGYYIQGEQKITLPRLYREIIKLLES
jgi:hypothetical protein